MAVANNARSFDTQFIINSAIILRRPELIMNELKVVLMREHYLTSQDSASYLAMLLRMLPQAFELAISNCGTRTILTRGPI
jgi:hypothetical protein